MMAIHRPAFALLMLCLPLLSSCDGKPPTKAAVDKVPAPPHLVVLGTAELTPQRQQVTRNGTLRARREVKVLTREEGQLIDLPYYEGDVVKAQTVLARQDDSLLQAQWEKARAQRRQAEADLKRLEQLQGRQLVSEDEQARAATAVEVARAEEKLLNTRLSHTRLHAPFAGVVSARLAEPGDILPSFTHILTLTDPSSLVTEVKVSELLLPALSVGDTAQVRIDALGNSDFEGRISRIFPSIDPDTRQGTLEVVLEPAPAGARPGQFCRVRLQGHPMPRLSIPFAGLRRDLQGEYVFHLGDDGAVSRTAVVTGMNLGDRIEVLDGLEAGAQVVVKGFLGLTDGMAVAAAGGERDAHE